MDDLMKQLIEAAQDATISMACIVEDDALPGVSLARSLKNLRQAVRIVEVTDSTRADDPVCVTCSGAETDPEGLCELCGQCSLHCECGTFDDTFDDGPIISSSALAREKLEHAQKHFNREDPR